MEQQKKIEYIKAALALQSINCDDFICDTIITTYEKIIELGGQFSLSDAAEIKMSLQEKHFPKKEKHKHRKK
jgi:hypothetical protein